jgi:thioredoxin-like negative regulator of GroEL
MPYFNPWRLPAKSRKIRPMPSLYLDSDNRDQLAAALDGEGWVVACLCAAWCGTCSSYRAGFEGLAERHPDTSFVWIDIEDQADVVGDLDVENFPTLLLQRGDRVAFFGTMLPDPKVAERLLQSQAALDDAELARLAASNEERRGWQRDANLRVLLANASGQS